MLIFICADIREEDDEREMRQPAVKRPAPVVDEKKMSESGEVQQVTSEPQVRRNFPETWIWQDTVCKYECSRISNADHSPCLSTTII